MEDRTRELLKPLLGPERVFGPVAIGSTTTNAEVLEALFQADNRAYKQLDALRPPFIVGRRGSGKTSLLRSGSSDDGYVAVELNTKKLLDSAASTIGRLRDLQVFILEDQAADVWDFVFANALIRKILLTHGPLLEETERDVLEHYTAHALHSGREPEDFSILALSKLLAHATDVNHRRANAGVPFEVLVHETEVNGIAFLLAFEALKAATLKLKLEPWVLVDSVEAFILADGIQAADHVLALPLAGLFQSISQLDEQMTPAFRVRLCFPAEVYHTFVDFSLNPMRDFSRQVMLHWSAAELIRIAAHRLRIYFEVAGEPGRIVVAKGNSARSKRQADHKQLLEVLPDSVNNGIGITEQIFPYLIRHTQLSPRHLIALLNRILAPAAADDPRLSRPASNQEVVDGVKFAESQMVNEIVGAYTRSHPLARKALEKVLVNLPTTFTEAEFELSHKEDGGGLIPVYEDFRRMAIELGAVGEVIRTTSDLHEVRFEYHLPHKLNIPVGPTVLLGVHPIFAQVIGSLGTKGKAYEGQLPVYPQSWQIEPDGYMDYRSGY